MASQTASTATKNQLITSLVQKELQFQVKIANSGLITDLSQFAVKGVREIHMPKLTSFTSSARTAGSAYTDSVVSDSADALLLNKIQGVQYILDSALVQSTVAFEIESAKRAASAVARKIENDVVDAILAAGTAVGTAGDITKSIILDARELLMTANADMNQVVLVVGPDQEKAMLGITDFTHAYVYGAGAPLYDGMIGKVFNIPVVVSNALAAGEFFFLEKSSFAVAFQAGPSIASMPAIEYGASATKSVVEVIWGCAPMQASAGVSPLIIKPGV